MISQTLLEITRANSSCFLAYIYDINRRRKIRATRAVAQSTTRWTLVQPVGAMHRWMLPSTGIPARPPLPARLTPRNSLRTHSMPARTAFMCRTQSAMCVLPTPKCKCPRLMRFVGSGCAERDGRCTSCAQSVQLDLSACAMLVSHVKRPHGVASSLGFSSYPAPCGHAGST